VSAAELPRSGEGEAPRGGSGAMFDAIAERYDLLNRVMSFGTDRGWRKKTVAALQLEARAAEHPERAARVLDLATGTADLALDVLARHPGVEVVGLDPSREMMRVGARKAEAAGVVSRISFIEGDAQALPLPDDSCDAICMAFGIRNVPDRALALREMRRVARPGARVAILELGEPRHGALAPLARIHIRHVVPRLGALISGASEYRYLQESVARFPTPEAFAELMAAAGLEVVEVRPLTFGVCTLFVGQVPVGRGEGV
jgi:demethylmenaquinone methyltransferase/2-methoxy-6-polyprenyl-1,4-benzoquinol methylase